MKPIYRKYYYGLLILIIGLLIITSGDVFAQPASKFKENVVRIKFEEKVSGRLDEMSKKPQVKTIDGIILTGFASIDQLNKKYKTKKFKRVFPHAGKFEPRHRENGLHLWYEMTFDEKTKVNFDNSIAEYKSDKSIETAEPVYEKKLIDDKINNNSTKGDNPSLSFTTNDPEFTNQWHYDNTGQTGGTPGADISLKNAWDIETGSTNVFVAVIDGGVDISHEDLSNSMWVNQTELNGTAGVDDDNNGYIDDIYGYNFVDNSGTIYADGHGTHVGGTIGAATNNGIGVSGIAGGSGSGDGVRLMSCAVFGEFDDGGFDQAFVYAADNGAVIAQNSWTYTYVGVYEQSVLDAIDYFIANAGYDEYGNPVGPMQGGIVIFAAGNDSDNGPWYPAYYEPVLSVASTNHNDEKSYYSNYGSWVDISAPGGETTVLSQGVLSTLPSNTYGYYQGTSMACPHVSGVAALIVSEYGDISLASQMVWDRLVQTTDDIDPLNSGYEGQLGSGRLNASNALQHDSIAPGAITDLAVGDTGPVNVILTWTATGSSADSGIASVYDIRYAEFMIDSANFSSATWVSNAPKPAAAGVTETFEITGLLSSTTYYFAIKAADYSGNISSISNIVSATTLDPPVMSVTPDSLSASLFTVGRKNAEGEAPSRKNFFRRFYPIQYNPNEDGILLLF